LISVDLSYFLPVYQDLIFKQMRNISRANFEL
jgi:hypothetical protein